MFTQPKKYIARIQVIFSIVNKIMYVLVNEPEQLQTTLALVYSLPIYSKVWSDAVHACSKVYWKMFLTH